MTVPDALFDLAVNRAATMLRGAQPTDERSALHEWHARTRFARRVPLEDIMQRLASKPSGEWHWSGGPGGSWQPGKPNFP